jgi:hypothetical protein
MGFSFVLDRVGGRVDERERIIQLIGQMQRLSDENWHILDLPVRAMEDKAWVGPSGKDFDGRVHGSARTMQSALTEALTLLHAKLNSTPPGTPPDLRYP